MGKSIQLNVRNIKKWLGQPSQDFDGILFDPNYDCNVRCVYCHNARSKEVVSTADFRAFLEEGVSGVDLFQVGCAMEPTLDPRLGDLMLLVSRSPARPRQVFRLQTNGILLHRHDHVKMRDAGLTIVTVSVDTVDASVFKQLRGGTSLPRVKSNLIEFHKTCPEITLGFITTVTRLNIGSIDELVQSGLELGITVFNLRQIFYYSDSKIVDHSQMPSLLVSDGEFLDMSAQVRAKYGNLARFHVQGAQAIMQASVPLRTESLLPLPPPLSTRPPIAAEV
jgi:molybdenum cofactor biosynthesis enzyme MoaA